MLTPIRDSLAATDARVEAIKLKRMRQNEAAGTEAEVEDGAAAEEEQVEVCVEVTTPEVEQEVTGEEAEEVKQGDEDEDEQEDDEQFYDAEDGEGGAVEMEGEKGEEGVDKYTNEVDDSLVARARRLGFFLVTGK